MAIVIKQGDIFESGADILVNPVNCKGAMGAGLALEFKKRFPDMYNYYKGQCNEKIINMGRTYFYPTKNQNVTIVIFPTKYNWVDDSKIEWISESLDDMVRKLRSYQGKRIAIPALGCGLGGLKWQKVEPLMLQRLRPVRNVMDILIYEPKED